MLFTGMEKLSLHIFRKLLGGKGFQAEDVKIDPGLVQVLPTHFFNKAVPLKRDSETETKTFSGKQFFVLAVDVIV